MRYLETLIIEVNIGFNLAQKKLIPYKTNAWDLCNFEHHLKIFSGTAFHTKKIAKLMENYQNVDLSRFYNFFKN